MSKDNNLLISGLDQWIEFMQAYNKDISGNWQVFKSILIDKHANHANIQQYLKELHTRLATDTLQRGPVSHYNNEVSKKTSFEAQISSISIFFIKAGKLLIIL
jgi:hypothetical protein